MISLNEMTHPDSAHWIYRGLLREFVCDELRNAALVLRAETSGGLDQPTYSTALHVAMRARIILHYAHHTHSHNPDCTMLDHGDATMIPPDVYHAIRPLEDFLQGIPLTCGLDTISLRNVLDRTGPLLGAPEQLLATVVTYLVYDPERLCATVHPTMWFAYIVKAAALVLGEGVFGGALVGASFEKTAIFTRALVDMSGGLSGNTYNSIMTMHVFAEIVERCLAIHVPIEVYRHVVRASADSERGSDTAATKFHIMRRALVSAGCGCQSPSRWCADHTDMLVSAHIGMFADRGVVPVEMILGAILGDYHASSATQENAARRLAMHTGPVSIAQLAASRVYRMTLTPRPRARELDGYCSTGISNVLSELGADPICRHLSGIAADDLFQYTTYQQNAILLRGIRNSGASEDAYNLILKKGAMHIYTTLMVAINTPLVSTATWWRLILNLNVDGIRDAMHTMVDLIAEQRAERDLDGENIDGPIVVVAVVDAIKDVYAHHVHNGCPSRRGAPTLVHMAARSLEWGKDRDAHYTSEDANPGMTPRCYYMAMSVPATLRPLVRNYAAYLGFQVVRYIADTLLDVERCQAIAHRAGLMTGAGTERVRFVLMKYMIALTFKWGNCLHAGDIYGVTGGELKSVEELGKWAQRVLHASDVSAGDTAESASAIWIAAVRGGGI